MVIPDYKINAYDNSYVSLLGYNIGIDNQNMLKLVQ